ncbi:hypothetical protein BDQ17DRAFT_949586 [Cyathus striatus]|nr:hypothetical protein BDQ17DRAFT_949586 [Cyathus striatus]
MKSQNILAFHGDIALMYQVARGIIAQNPSLLWKYDEWTEIRRSLLSFGNAPLHSLCMDLASEQLARNTSKQTPQDRTRGPLSKLSQWEFEGLCSHVYYEIRRRHSEYKSANNESSSESQFILHFIKAKGQTVFQRPPRLYRHRLLQYQFQFTLGGRIP